MRRVSEFDALRGLAVLGLLVFHLDPDGAWTRYGMTGIHFFLVLSGYLITDVVLRRIDEPGFFRAFYARRILRVAPAYYFTLGLMVILHRLTPGSRPLDGLAYDLTFSQFTWGWPILRRFLTAPATPLPAFEHTFTLAIIAQTYLIWPIAIRLVRPSRVVLLCLGVVGLVLWFKTLGNQAWILPNFIGAFALGGLVAAILRDRGRVERNRGGLSMAFLVGSLVGFAYLRWYYVIPVSEWPRSWMLWRDSFQNFAYYLIHFGIVGIVALHAGGRLLAPLRIAELRFLGEISLGLYLYHMPVYWLVGGHEIRTGEPWTTWVAKVAITFVAASLSFRYIERPILSLKALFPYGSGTGSPTQPAPPPARQPRIIHARPTSAEADRAASSR